MRISSLFHYFFGLPNKDLEIIEKVKKQRHLVHKQINLSKIKLKPTLTIEKNGFYDLQNKKIKPAIISLTLNKINFVDEFDKKHKTTKKKKR